MLDVIAAVYLCGVVFTGGVGVGDQLSMTHTEWRLIVTVSLLWPVFAAIYVAGVVRR